MKSWSCWCKVLFPFFSCHLPFLDHVHELDAGNGTLCRVKRFEPEPGTGHPLALVRLPVASMLKTTIRALMTNVVEENEGLFSRI
jgi:hypothetical protein